MRSQTQLEIRVIYNAPVHSARRVLRVLPLQRSTQTIVSERWHVEPTPDTTSEKPDQFGNRRLFVVHRAIKAEFRFALQCEVETTVSPLFDPAPQIGLWKMPSRAVRLELALQRVAAEGKPLAPLDRALHWARFCHDNLAYTAQSSATPLLAGQVWENRLGTCADFTHVFLALCRASGLAARYVAGFNPAEGQMHAWAEVLIQNHWHAFDPTHGRQTSPGCVVVAVGRDFYDVPPITGSFRGEAAPQLNFYCRTFTSS